MNTKKKIAVITDNSFINVKLFEQNSNLKSINLTMILPDGREIKNESDITEEEFYKILDEDVIKTSQPAIGLVENTWNQILSEYDYLIVAGITKKMSGAYSTQHALSIRKEFKDRVILINTHGISSILERMVIAILEHIKTAEFIDLKTYKEDLMVKIKEIQSSYKCLLFPKSLETLKKGGRIGNSIAKISNLLKILPILIYTNGKIEPYGIMRNYWKGIIKQLALLKKHIKANLVEIALSKFDDEKFENKLREIIHEAGFEKIRKVNIPKIMLAHWGKNFLIINIWKSEK